MVMTRLSIPALVARAARQRALQRHAHARFLLQSSPSIARAVVSRGSFYGSQDTACFASKSKSSKLPSFEILEAFDDANTAEDDALDEVEDSELGFGYDIEGEPIDGGEDTSSTHHSSAPHVDTAAQLDKKEIARSFRFAMERKQQWMAKLSEAGDFDTLLRVVYECYEPLYFSHPLLTVEESSLVDKYSDPMAVAAVSTRFRPKWYDDQVTKITEQEAMSLFVQSGRPDLAIAVFEHREWIASTIGTVIVPGRDSLMEDKTIDLTEHVRSYYSWAMGAFSAIGDHAHVFSVYESALERGILPTANMTMMYANSLVTKRENAAVLALYDQIQHDDRPVNMYFYRQMLFVARTTCNSTMMTQIVRDMKFKGFKLRAEDYLNAIRSLDDQYFMPHQPGAKSAFVRETYAQMMTRIRGQRTSPEDYARLESASEHVLQLFDEMVVDEQLEPSIEQFFPRVLAAAVFLHQYDRVDELLAMYEQLFHRPMTDPAAVNMIVNLKLLRHEPVEAWETVIRIGDAVDKYRPHSSTVPSLGNVVEYLIDRNDTPRLLELLQIMDDLRLMVGAMDDALLAQVLKTLIQDTTNVSDTELFELVNVSYRRMFPVYIVPAMFKVWVKECINAGRDALADKLIHSRGKNSMPTLPGDLAVWLSETVKASSPLTPEQLKRVALLPIMVDIAALPEEDKVTFCCNVIRALHALLVTDTDVKRQHQRVRFIKELRDKHLGRNLSKLPRDVREILMVFV